MEIVIFFLSAVVAFGWGWFASRGRTASDLRALKAENERQFAEHASVLEKQREQDRATAKAYAAAEIRDVQMRAEAERQRQNERLAEVEKERVRERETTASELREAKAHYESELRSELQRLEPLRRFESMAEAEQNAQRSLSEALALAESLRAQAKAYAESEKARTDMETRAARERAKEHQQLTETLLKNATENARLLLDDAHKKAEAIGGNAYLALREKDGLEQAVKAIRNVIDGYGDRYVVPTRSVLDELAADFSHLEAGQRLTIAREHSRRMVEENHAATCDYSEAKRKETAVRFVVDAFNGRVDGILSRTKHDNMGTLEQEIRDAFSLVNLNGEAFRNARILEAYRDARIDELKWAVTAQELRLREREEQRRIQEEIREEEKARKEAERVIKETQREEAMLRAALEKARAEVESSSADEKARHQQELDALAAKLIEAETRNQRAKSMAEQTRAGTVYIISNIGSFGEGMLKIGMTRRLEPMDRIWELGDASVPFDFDVHAMIRTDDAPALERELHLRFDGHRVNRVNLRKEFFYVSVHELRAFVTEKELQASFTMAAEAREYRESLALKNGQASTTTAIVEAAEIHQPPGGSSAS